MRKIGLFIVWALFALWTYLMARGLVLSMPGCVFTTPQSCNDSQLSAIGIAVLAVLVVWSVVATPLTVLALYVSNRPRLASPRPIPEIMTSCSHCGTVAPLCDEVCRRCGSPLAVDLDKAHRRNTAAGLLIFAALCGVYMARGADRVLEAGAVADASPSAKLYTDRLP